MKLDAELADRIVATLAEHLPEGVRVKRRHATLLVASSSGRFERSYTSQAVFAHLPRRNGAHAIEDAMTAALETIVDHLESEDLSWPGLDPGHCTVCVDQFGGEVRASVRDTAGNVLEFAPVIAAPEDLAEDPTPDEEVEPVAARLHTELAARLRTELVAGAPPIDNLPLWLLRVGIDHSGQVSFTQLWDVAIRAAVLAQLRLSGRIVETDESMEVDTEASDLPYENIALQQLLAQRTPTEASWICTGALRAADVAASLVTSGEWSRHLRPLDVGRYEYRAPKQQYIPLRRRLAHTYDGEIAPVSDGEAAAAVLGHTLNLVRPVRLGSRLHTSDDPLQPFECGALAEIVSSAVTEMKVRTALSNANPNPTW